MTITLDPILEKKAAARAKELGKTLDEVIYIQLQDFIEDETPTPGVLRELKQVEEDYKSNKVSRGYTDAREMFADMLTE